jgi:hypothetical protein
MCHLRAEAISRNREQPGSAGGNFFLIALPAFQLHGDWADIAGDTRISLPN